MKPMHPACTDIAARFGLRRSGARHVGQCPECGGSSTTDRFVLFDDGGYKCFSCGIKGDRIAWLRTRDGLSCKEAHDVEGQSCSPSCPQYGPCRSGQPQTRPIRRSLSVPSSTAGSTVPVMRATLPLRQWQAWATGVQAKATATLARMPEHIEWLSRRGITAAMVDQAGLGWLGHDQRVAKAQLGLPCDAGRDKLWVPAGLVIPTLVDGQVHRLRIRRTPESRARFLPERKYEWLRGSGTMPLQLGPTSRCRGAVIVEAELDAMAVAAANSDVLVIALGTVAGGVTSQQHQLLRTAPVVLVALDADPDRDGQQGPGPKAVQRWLATYRQARFWPVPAGKDPGEYVADHGGDLRAWVDAGLPPVITAPSQPPRQDESFAPEQCSAGVGGDDDNRGYRVLTLTDGTEICITENQELWHQLAAGGLLVFSDNELIRLQHALTGLEGEDRAAALAVVLDAKRVFGAAYVYAGRGPAEVAA